MDFPGFDDMSKLSQWASNMLALYTCKAAAKDIADGAFKEVKDGLHATAGRLWGWLKDRFAGDKLGGRQIEKFEQAPQDRTADLAGLLKLHMEGDEGFREEIMPFLTELKDLQAKLPPQTTHAPQTAVAVNGNVVQVQGNGNSIGNAT